MAVVQDSNLISLLIYSAYNFSNRILSIHIQLTDIINLFADIVKEQNPINGFCGSAADKTPLQVVCRGYLCFYIIFSTNCFAALAEREPFSRANRSAFISSSSVSHFMPFLAARLRTISRYVSLFGLLKVI